MKKMVYEFAMHVAQTFPFTAHIKRENNEVELCTEMKRDLSEINQNGASESRSIKTCNIFCVGSSNFDLCARSYAPLHPHNERIQMFCSI